MGKKGSDVANELLEADRLDGQFGVGAEDLGDVGARDLREAGRARWIAGVRLQKVAAALDVLVDVVVVVEDFAVAFEDLSLVDSCHDGCCHATVMQRCGRTPV